MLLRWSVADNEVTQSIELSGEIYPTDLEWLPRNPTMSKLGDLILMTSADGRFHIMNRNGRIERSVDAHKGAILVGRWSHDGAGLLTGKLVFLTSNYQKL